MKKLLSFIAAVALCLSFTACGNKTEPQQTEQPAQSDVLVRSGYNETDGSYYNSYTQITVTPPGDWYIYRDSDLAAAYLDGRVTGDELSVWGSAEFAQQTVIPDIAFMDMANNNSFSVVYVNLANVENGADMDETAFLNLVAQAKGAQGFGADQEMYATVGGKDFKLLQLTGENHNIYMLAKKQDNYMAVITATDHSGIGGDVFLGFVS